MKGIEAVNQPLQRAATLPRYLFTDQAVFDREMQRLFYGTWQCIGRVDEVARPGDYRTFEIGGSGVIVLRDSDGELRAYHNVCRHRGTRILEAESGSGLSVLQCPYHAWTYDLGGSLIGAPHMEHAEDFNRGSFSLHPVHLETWRGFVFVNLSSMTAPLEDYLGDFADRAKPYPLERLRQAHRVIYDIASNWKLVVQNANECYHCPGVHPQLSRLTPYRSGEEDMKDGPVFGGWMDFVDGVTSLTESGTTKRRPFPGITNEDRRRVYYYVLYPANFLSFLPDYVTLDWFMPLGPDRTRLMFDLYVDSDEPGPAEDAMAFWDTTNRQDWHICEMAHLGAKTIGFTQGRYSGEEEVVHAIDRYYLQHVGLLRKG
jgi:Rieske 2Fe-2S family protein